VGRFPRVFAALKPWANFRSAWTRSRPLTRLSRAFGFTEFLSPLPKLLKSAQPKLGLSLWFWLYLVIFGQKRHFSGVFTQIRDERMLIRNG